jgi:hypothetical protein
VVQPTSLSFPTGVEVEFIFDGDNNKINICMLEYIHMFLNSNRNINTNIAS